MMKKLLLVSVIMLQISGCASYFKRQECDKINWYTHGEEIAMRGEWLNSDTTLNECRKAEAEISESKLDQGFKSGREKYCSPTNAYIVGKVGDNFARDLCDSPNLTTLLSQHQKGLRDYCAKTNGFDAGASGKKYKSNCPADLEKAFLPEYKKGRLKYIQAEIINLETRRKDNQGALANKNTQLNGAIREQSNWEMRRSWLESQRSFAVSSKNSIEVARLDSQIQEVGLSLTTAQNDAQRVRNEITALENDQKKIEEQTASYRSEMASLSANP